MGVFKRKAKDNLIFYGKELYELGENTQWRVFRFGSLQELLLVKLISRFARINFPRESVKLTRYILEGRYL